MNTSFPPPTSATPFERPPALPGSQHASPSHWPYRFLVAGVVGLMVVGGVGVGAIRTLTNEAPMTTPTTTPTAVPTPATAASSAMGAVDGLDSVKDATVQIVAAGSFRDPAFGEAEGLASGSGFFVSDDGLVVTNNHVVTGAATLEVFIGGDTSVSYNAAVVGVSECSDLALLQVDVDVPVPYLEWYEGPIVPGIDVYTAGFPLGDPEFTLTKGIVAKARAGGDVTGTSSIDHTIEHDANIQPGNSGGPLVTSDGAVVGVNYAGGAMVTTTEQFFAIAADLAEPVVEELSSGDIESVGVNGQAVVDEAAGLAGIWVSGVTPGSAASSAELLPGDVITSMNGLSVGADGTFKDYCDVIRTAGDRPIDIEVLRYNTGEQLSGELNGDRPLEVTSAADVVAEQTDTAASATTYASFVPLTDSTGTITMEVPTEWSDVDLDPVQLEDGIQAPYIGAAPDLAAYSSDFGSPGVEFAKFGPSAGIDVDLVSLAPTEATCADLGVTDYDDGTFVGKYQMWEQCGGTDAAVVVLVAQPADASYSVVVVGQIVTDADVDALGHVFATFNLTAAAT